MRDSRVESPRRFAGAVLTAVLILAEPAAAQLGPPVQLVPLPPPPTAPAPAAPQAAPPAAAASPDSPDITTAPLAPMDNSWLGTLEDNQGALPQTMWQGTTRGFLAASLPQLAPSISPSLQGLARRLLLSNALSPAGPDAANRPSLAAMRLDRLLALGEVAGATALIDQLPADPSGDAMDRDRVELRFAANDRDGACSTVNDVIPRIQNPWWDRALIACQALGGETAKAALGLSLLRDEKAPPDPSFDALIDAVGGQNRKIDRLPDPSPMHLALIGATKLPLPADALANAGPAALLGYATNGAVPVERRLPAAERAAMLGALPPPALGELYLKLDFKPEEQTAALKGGKPPEDPKSRAILYAVAHSNSPAEMRAAAITALLAEAKKRGAFPETAQLIVPLLGELRPENGTPAFAADVARVWLLQDDAAAAAPWIASAGVTELQVVSRLAAPPPRGGADTPALMRDTITALASRSSAQAPGQIGLLLALLAAFDEPVGALDEALHLVPPHDAKLPSAALWLAQQQATDGKRVGETVLTTVLLAQAGDRLSLEPILLGRAIAGLRAIGLEGEAHALALEAAIAAGI